MGLDEIADGHWLTEPPPSPIFGAAIDSRKILPGQLFVAIRTDHDDGHRHLEMALRAGASAALVSSPQPHIPIPQLCVANPVIALRRIAAAHRSSFDCPVIAVAGSYGKTTAKELMATLLGRERCCATEDNLNNTLGVPLTLLNIRPDVHRHAVIEVGISEPGEMEIIAPVVRPRHVIFTGISHKHEKFFSSQRQLLEEKLHIAAWVNELDGTFVTPASMAGDPALLPLRSRMVCTMDRSRPWPISPAIPHFAFFRKNCSIAIRQPGGSTLRHFHLPRPSDGFAQSFALCYAMATLLGISDDTVAERLLLWRWPRLRGQILCDPVKGCSYYLDCYNSDVCTLEDASQSFARMFPKSPRLLVIGAMAELGNASDALHWEAGMSLAFLPSDKFFFIGNEVLPLRSALLARHVPRTDAIFFDSKEELGQALASFRGAVFIKGSRCHALETLIALDRCQDLG
ncbi:MAG: hypothetical protein LBP65_00565 [Puniceicoccales bacterium]|jgi:UDP-N-acetylmuramoyl-tripeptide--D-alanyl-D-alanine ligase|nr:hypothetical protein [Puniceicoccales bacterium]